MSDIRYGVDNGRDGIAASLVFNRLTPDDDHPVAYVPEGSGSRFYLRAEEIDEAEVVAVRQGRRSTGRVFQRPRVLGHGLRLVRDEEEADRVLIRRPIVDPGVAVDEPGSPVLVPPSRSELVTLAAFAIGVLGALVSFHHNSELADGGAS